MAKRSFISRPDKSKQNLNSNAQKRHNDLGFSSDVVKNRKRYINKDGSLNVKQNGSTFSSLQLYQWLVLMSWPKFILATVVFYFVLNTIFTGLYLANGIEYLTGVEEHSMSDFWTAFFFSAQTLTTVGYGSLSPIGFLANFIAAIGALTGLMSFALGTGLLFVKFSKPSANILFSENALIAPYKDGAKAFMFRIANRRKNMITNLRVEVIATWIGKDEKGRDHRNYRPLQLERDQLSMMPLSWTIVHPIDRRSPIFECNQGVCEKMDLEIIIIIEGYDETFANIIRTQSSYKYNEIVRNAKFNPAFYVDEEGYSILELDKLNDYSTLR